MKLTKRNRLFVASTLMVSLVVVPVQASAKGFLESMFDDMWTATTDPAFITTQSRGGLVGGSFTARIPTKPISVFAVDPPRISAGCGGIDMVGGSFSFINSDELVALLRTIGQQAKALLFKLAVDAINKSIGGLITEFSEKVQAMNDMLKNTCAVAQGAVDLFAPDSWKTGIEGQQKTYSEKFAAAGGAVGDMFAGIKKGFTDWEWSKKKTENTALATGKVKDPNMYNLVWRQARDSNALQRLAQGVGVGDNYGVALMLMINVTGTAINKENTGSETNCTEGGAPIPNCGQQVVEVGGKLLTADLIAPGEIDINVCNDEPVPVGGLENWLKAVDKVTGCQTMVSVKMKNIYTGTQAFVNEAVFGVQDEILTPEQMSGSSGGLVGYLVNGTALTSRAKGLLSQTDVPLLGYLRKVQRDKTAVAYVAKIIAPLIAEEEAVKLMEGLVNASRAIYAEGASNTTMPGSYTTNIAIAQQDLLNRRMNMGERKEALVSLNRTVESIVQNLPKGASMFAVN